MQHPHISRKEAVLNAVVINTSTVEIIRRMVWSKLLSMQKRLSKVLLKFILSSVEGLFRAEESLNVLDSTAQKMWESVFLAVKATVLGRLGP